MSSPKPPPKSILKQVNTNTANTSWFSKFNSDTNTTPPISPRINNLFSSFRKQQPPPSLPPPQQQQQSDISNNEEIAAELAPKELKRVRFPVVDKTTEYQFKRDDLVEEKKEITAEPMNIQTCSQLLSVYETVCRKKQEPTIDLLVLTLANQPQATFLTRLELTNQPINRNNIDPLVDIMCIEFGLRELVLNNCGLEDDATKILMHCLLNNDKMTHLSLANNPKLTTNSFKYIAVYVKGSRQLTNLDLSYTQPDKKGIQYITSATHIMDKDSRPSLKTLLLNHCGLRNTQMEVLAAGMKKLCSIRHLYLRGNKFMNGGALSIGVMLRDYDTSLQSLEGLYLDNNDLSQGIQYITQALRRNQCLVTLSMCDCKIDAKGCILVGESLKYNQHLERFDIGYNPLCSSNLDGITLLGQALNVNRTLKDLRLSDTGLGTEAAIALAECLPENNSLSRLDISRNPQIDIAGLMALSVSIRMNHTITFIDINIPTDNKEMVEIHNDILATCTRNAQSKSKKPTINQDNSSHSLVTTTQATARLTLQERLAAVTKGKNNKAMSTSSSEITLNQSALAKPMDKEINQDDAILTQQAFDCVGSLEDVLTNSDNGSIDSDVANGIHKNCIIVQSTICERIPFISDPSQLEILLAINDRLTTAIQNYEANYTLITSSHTVEAININIDSKQTDQEEETLSSSFEIGDDEDGDEEDEEEGENHLKELRSEIEAEESAAFLKAKQLEMDEAAVITQL